MIFIQTFSENLGILNDKFSILFTHFEITRGNINQIFFFYMVWRYLGIVNRKKDKESETDSEKESAE